MSYPTQLLVLHRAHCELLASSSLTVPEYLGYFAQWMDSDSTDCSFFGFATDSDDYLFMHDYVYRYVHGLEPPAL